MNRQELIAQIQRKKSFLCVGLDTEWSKLPPHLLDEEDPIFAFNRAIIDATREYCVAYKPNLAFYEVLGPQGWISLQKTIDHIGSEHFTIADAKRGDIGNTSRLYAQTFFDTYAFDSVTVAPYMGADSVQPFLDFPNKWVILLALTSNIGSGDFQLGLQDQQEPLFEKVMRKAMQWGTPENLMFVVGATHPEKFAQIRAIAPDHFLLVPGVGAQGGDLEALCRYGLNGDVGLLVNASRGIIYAGSGVDFAERAQAAAAAIQVQMERLMA